MGRGRRRLVLLLSQLGDFDSLEYAQALVPVLPQLEAAGIALLAIGIGDEAGRQQFCAFTGFPPERLLVDAEPHLHRDLGLYEGLRQAGGPWPNLLLMCAGLGSPGTLAEVLRGYTGDRSAPLGPFELATVRLRNMAEVLGHWRTYVPRDDFLTQRGGTFLLDADDTLLYSHRDPGVLGFSATMARPLSFLDPFLG
ncbi:peroxiredoxin-like family protein [Cyanobium gracile]|uniref:Peroxiredoxin-like family protein n=1 Tax=Cyanobium gracile UHCC 0281 TaxID=3110309 RepID=A0ABU5SWF0_9CYAN|nr:peroxiredoxin-like family protein [Cyanobium gracile]MEA5442845.1 peroxiredoxin-like family protein [Cyanobium gracile UHCC 0281]